MPAPALNAVQNRYIEGSDRLIFPKDIMTMLHKKVDKGIKLFGVRLNSTDSPLAMRKSVSMVNLAGYASPEAPSPSSQPDHHLEQEGYASDDLVQSTSSIRERKKGVPWTENEHGLFLIGLQRLGKGDWRGISRNFVRTRTPTQVASHAQKYFLRQSNISKRRRRSSLFDMTPDKVPSMISQEKAGKEDILPEGTDLCLGHKLPVNDGDGMDSDVVAGFPVPLAPCLHSDGPAKAPAVTDRAIKHGQPLEARGVESMDGVQHSAGIPISSFPVGYKGIPSLDPHLFPSFTFYQWVAVNRFDHQGLWPANPNIVKPTPVVPQSPVRIDESLKISELSLNATRPVMEPTPLSFKLLEEGSRHSAFHATSSVGTTDLDSKGSLSSAISVA